MKQETIVIQAEAGIHARPAGIIVKAAAGYTSKITIEKDGKPADAKRLMGLLSLGVKKGEQITLTVEGDDEEVAFDTIKKIILEAE